MSHFLFPSSPFLSVLSRASSSSFARVSGLHPSLSDINDSSKELDSDYPIMPPSTCVCVVVYAHLYAPAAASRRQRQERMYAGKMLF